MRNEEKKGNKGEKDKDKSDLERWACLLRLGCRDLFKRRSARDGKGNIIAVRKC